MTALTIRITSVERFAHDGSVDTLPLKAGINVVVGPKDTGKTAWLSTISFLLGDTGTPEEALGAGLSTKFDSARLQLTIGGDSQVVIERRWKESGAKHKVFVNGDGMASSDFSVWIQKALGIPSLRFPRGNPYSGAPWPELSWRMLFRHMYREERFWADLADKQPEKEQHACLLQFLGVASKVYSQELGDEIRQRQSLLALRARRDQFDEVLLHTTRSLLAESSVRDVPTRESLAEGVARSESRFALAKSNETGCSRSLWRVLVLVPIMQQHRQISPSAGFRTNAWR